MNIKHVLRNRRLYSEDEDYYSQNQQRFSTNHKNNNWKIDQPDPINQPDLFESYTRNEQTRQTRQNSASFNKNFQLQSPVKTQSYPPTQMQKKIPLQ